MMPQTHFVRFRIETEGKAGFTIRGRRLSSSMCPIFGSSVRPHQSSGLDKQSIFIKTQGIQKVVCDAPLNSSFYRLIQNSDRMMQGEHNCPCTRQQRRSAPTEKIERVWSKTVLSQTTRPLVAASEQPLIYREELSPVWPTIP